MLLYYFFGGEGATNKHILMLLVIYALAALMVSKVRYFRFKEIKLHRRHPFWVLLGLIVLIMLTIAAPELMLVLGITRYALSGPRGAGVWCAAGRRRRRAPAGARRRRRCDAGRA